MPGARRATVVIPGSLPDQESKPARTRLAWWFALPEAPTRSAPR